MRGATSNLKRGAKQAVPASARFWVFIAFFACVSVLFAGSSTSAQEGVPGTGSIANEGRPNEPQGSCSAESSDVECLEYWEHNINWLSWDYKKPYASPEHRHMPAPFGFALFNFAVFAFIMFRLAAGPLREFVLARHNTIRHDLDEAARLHREAEARLGEYEAKIAGLGSEIEALLASIRADAETERARIVAGAEAQAEKLKHDAEAQITLELARVKRELKVEAVGLAIAVAEQLIGKNVNPMDQVQLADRFIADLEKTQAPSPSTRS